MNKMNKEQILKMYKSVMLDGMSIEEFLNRMIKAFPEENIDFKSYYNYIQSELVWWQQSEK